MLAIVWLHNSCLNLDTSEDHMGIHWPLLGSNANVDTVVCHNTAAMAHSLAKYNI